MKNYFKGHYCIKLNFIFNCAFFLCILLSNNYIFAANLDRYGGSLVLTTTSDPKSFNDIIAKETSTTAITSKIFEGLTTLNPYTLIPEPNLAKKWDISEDGLTWTFYLRDDVFWHDGIKFTADDVVFTFKDLIYNPNIPNSSKDTFTIDDKKIDVKKNDDYIVEFKLPVKFAPFLMGMSQSILPKHKLSDSVEKENFNHTWGIDTDLKEIVGTGPFKLSKYSPGQQIALIRNDNYWKKSIDGDKLPYLDKIIYLIVQSVDTSMLKFIDQEVDYLGLRGSDFPLIKPLEKKLDFTVYDSGADFGSNFVNFNMNNRSNPETKERFVPEYKSKWFNDLFFRKAVAHAIDKKKIIEIVMNGLGYPQDSAMSPSAGYFFNDNVTKYDYDLNKARSILANAGYLDRNSDGIIEDKNGNNIEFNLYTNAGGTERIQIAGILRHDLELLGMKVNFQALEFNTLVSKLTSTFAWDAIIIGLTGGIEPHFGKNVWNSNGGLHMWNPMQAKPATDWEKEIDDIFNRAVQELDQVKRKELYDTWQQIVSDQLPLIYTVLGSNIYAVRNKFGNLHPTSLGGAFHNLEEIYVKPEYR